MPLCAASSDGVSFCLVFYFFLCGDLQKCLHVKKLLADIQLTSNEVEELHLRKKIRLLLCLIKNFFSVCRLSKSNK